MRCKFIKNGIDPGAEIHPAKITATAAARRQIPKKGTPEPVIGENTVNIGSHHLPVRRHCAVETAANVQNGPAAVIARCLAHMDFVAADVRAISYGGRHHLGQGLFSGKHRFDIKMAKPFSSSL